MTRTHRRSTAQRGYGAQHQALRARWRPYVEAGKVDCARCHERIAPGAEWDLGHDDHDRRKYRGPEHQRCNRGAPRQRAVPPPPAIDPAAPFDASAWS